MSFLAFLQASQWEILGIVVVSTIGAWILSNAALR